MPTPTHATCALELQELIRLQGSMGGEQEGKVGATVVEDGQGGIHSD